MRSAISASPASPTRMAAGARPTAAPLARIGSTSTSAFDEHHQEKWEPVFRPDDAANKEPLGMFTGIITDIGRVAAVEARGDTRLRIACGYDMAGVDLGASIACSGV